jgi:hypothetical protein
MGNKWFQTQIEMFDERFDLTQPKYNHFFQDVILFTIFFHARCLDFTYDLINGQLADQQKF